MVDDKYSIKYRVNKVEWINPIPAQGIPGLIVVRVFELLLGIE